MSKPKAGEDILLRAKFYADSEKPGYCWIDVDGEETRKRVPFAPFVTCDDYWAKCLRCGEDVWISTLGCVLFESVHVCVQNTQRDPE
jgi:hypothetical protein